MSATWMHGHIYREKEPHEREQMLHQRSKISITPDAVAVAPAQQDITGAIELASEYAGETDPSTSLQTERSTSNSVNAALAKQDITGAIELASEYAGETDPSTSLQTERSTSS